MSAHLWVLPSVLSQTPLHPQKSVQQLLLRKRLCTSWWFLGLTLYVRGGIVHGPARGFIFSQRRQGVSWRAPDQVLFRWGAEQVFRSTGTATNQWLHWGNFQLQFLGKWRSLLSLHTRFNYKLLSREINFNCNQRGRRRMIIKSYVRRSTFIPVDATSGRPCWSFGAALKVKRNYEQKQICVTEHVLVQLVIHTQHDSSWLLWSEQY